MCVPWAALTQHKELFSEFTQSPNRSLILVKTKALSKGSRQPKSPWEEEA